LILKEITKIFARDFANLLDPLGTRQARLVLVERWRQTYNRIRPHSALGYRPPAPETIATQYA